MAKNTKTTKSDEQLAAELQHAGIDSATATVAAVTANALTAGSSEGATGSTAAVTKTTRTRIEPGSKPSQVLGAHITDQTALHTAATLHRGDEVGAATFKATAAKLDGLAKKVAEKGVNLLRYRGEPEKIQVYTRMGLEQIVSEGATSSKGLVDMFSTKYKPGTARAQANQLMSLFPALGIAERDGSNLKLAKGSLIVSDFKRAVAKSGS